MALKGFKKKSILSLLSRGKSYGGSCLDAAGSCGRGVIRATAKSSYVIENTTKYERMTGGIGLLACASACRLESLHHHNGRGRLGLRFHCQNKDQDLGHWDSAAAGHVITFPALKIIAIAYQPHSNHENHLVAWVEYKIRPYRSVVWGEHKIRPYQTGLSMLRCCRVGTANHVPDLLSQIAEVLRILLLARNPELETQNLLS
ncbi:MAG TPA: hypothetical protein DCY27_09290 [Desulfobacterales bacterium]|nr:hypothetical protein [Desulfobacterales bacterium]